MSREDTDEVRARRKRVPMNSADAEAWIRAQREARQEFEKNEGKALYEHDEEMDRLHKEHANIGAEEQARQREFDRRLRENQDRHEEQQAQQQAQSSDGPADRDRVVQFAMEQDQKQREERQQQEQQQGRSM